MRSSPAAGGTSTGAPGAASMTATRTKVVRVPCRCRRSSGPPNSRQMMARFPPVEAETRANGRASTGKGYATVEGMATTIRANTFLQRLIGAAALDAAIYEEVESDVRAT